MASLRAAVFMILVTGLGLNVAFGSRVLDDGLIVMPGSEMADEEQEVDDFSVTGTRWGVLIAGSAGYGNYRHQADVCHAYQILRRNGVKEENIVVFMYDDIAYNVENPRQGVIINRPDGSDVYHGVPKDYTGKDVTVSNFLAAILGDKSAIKGGSGKVVDSGPDDHIFIYYTDHGGPGVLGMPTSPNLYAVDFVDTLKKKHAAGTYKKLVIYLEACESGSIFEGLLPEGLNIYVTTASNAVESSWGTYCPGMFPPPPPEFDTCLGDLYSVAWMEDSEVENLKKETLSDQYLIVKKRTSNHNTYRTGSHVMQYGDLELNIEQLWLYLGFDPANENVTTPVFESSNVAGSNAVSQRDADLLHLWQKFRKAEENSNRKFEAGQELMNVISHRMHVDNSVRMIGELLFGSEAGSRILDHVVSPGQALVGDWNCLKSMVRTFEGKCGPLTQYGMKNMRALANLCNVGVSIPDVEAVAATACARSSYGLGMWHPLTEGFSA